jgi:hypothetical protein
MRDDKWLLSRLDHLWLAYFSDVPQLNPVFIHFGRFARLRFGSIKLDRRSNKTYITITGMFKDEKVPEEIVDHTIAHELCHYAHGFSSPHAQLHRFPHEGGVIKTEMEKRDLVYLISAYRKWIKGYREELRDYYSGKRQHRTRCRFW